jgi:hypothetical protein
MKDDNNNNNGYGLILHKEPSIFAIPCTSSFCGMSIEDKASTERHYFSDTLSSSTYCELCGNRLRYHRKKATARGEDIPVSFEEVEARHDARFAAIRK